jgi:hypothetical protein
MEWTHPALAGESWSGELNVRTVAKHFGRPPVPEEATVDLLGRPGDVNRVVGALEDWFRVLERDEIPAGSNIDVRLRIIESP